MGNPDNKGTQELGFPTSLALAFECLVIRIVGARLAGQGHWKRAFSESASVGVVEDTTFAIADCSAASALEASILAASQ